MKNYILRNKRNIIALLVILIAVSITGSFYLQKKGGYYVDEGMTLFLANGQYNGGVTTQSGAGFQDFVKEYVLRDSFSATVSNVKEMLQDVMGAGNYSQEGTVEWYDAARKMLQGENSWMDGEELYRQITVSPEERFDYLQVYINQAMDVHPPLYYFIVHTVFGIFAGNYSDAYLFGINLFFLLAACVVLYCMAEELWNRPELSLGIVAAYGFSQGFLSCVLYFRMYAMETFAVMATLYLYLCMQKKQWNCTRRERFALGAAAVLGFMIHYYYILYLVPLFVIACVRMLKAHQTAACRKYFGSMVLAGIVSVILWPFSLYHILFGYRGTEAISNLNMTGLGGKLRQCAGTIRTAIFLDNFWVMLLAAAVLAGSVILSFTGYCGSHFYGCSLHFAGSSANRGALKTQNTDENKGGRPSGGAPKLICPPELWIPAVFYGLIVIKVAPAVSDRYIMCLFPILFLLLGMAVTELIERFLPKRVIRRIMAGVVCVSYVVASLCLTTPNYLYSDQLKMKPGYASSPAELNCLMIADDDYRGFPEAVKLSRFDQVMVIGAAEMERLQENPPRERGEQIVVYIFGGLEVEQVLQEAVESLDREKGDVQEIESDIADFRAFII